MNNSYDVPCGFKMNKLKHISFRIFDEVYVMNKQGVYGEIEFDPKMLFKNYNFWEPNFTDYSISDQDLYAFQYNRKMWRY